MRKIEGAGDISATRRYPAGVASVMQWLLLPQFTPDADPAMLEPVQSAALSRAPSVAHGFFTRTGGVSTGVYASLNCGLGSDDERAAVIENRARVARHLGTDAARLLTCHQYHSATAIRVDAPWPPHAQPKADALVTRVPGLALGALAADCTPVLFADPVARVVGAAHADLGFRPQPRHARLRTRFRYDGPVRLVPDQHRQRPGAIRHAAPRP